MKELSIEEKAKRYDGAIDKAKKELDACGSQDCDAARQIFRLFPEIKESGDERVRKRLIFDFKVIGKTEWGGLEVKDILAWLEKQGKKNLDDEVEPKFKVCEWLTENHPNSYARFMQILEIINVQGKKRYRISRDLHNDEDIVECRFVEDNWHSFNIRDIKDGDILVASDGSVFIYAGSTDIYAKFYVALTKCGILNLEGGNWEDKKSVYPATKEQHERFFAAMHDAGYEWDAEKKELKKIEQEPIDCNEEYYNEELKNALFTSLRDAREQYLREKNAAWSDEDENILEAITYTVKNSGYSHCIGVSIKVMIAWLKSLKQRIGG